MHRCSTKTKITTQHHLFKKLQRKHHSKDSTKTVNYRKKSRPDSMMCNALRRGSGVEVTSSKQTEGWEVEAGGAALIM